MQSFDVPIACIRPTAWVKIRQKAFAVVSRNLPCPTFPLRRLSPFQQIYSATTPATELAFVQFSTLLGSVSTQGLLLRFFGFRFPAKKNSIFIHFNFELGTDQKL